MPNPETTLCNCVTGKKTNDPQFPGSSATLACSQQVSHSSQPHCAGVCVQGPINCCATKVEFYARVLFLSLVSWEALTGSHDKPVVPLEARVSLRGEQGAVQLVAPGSSSATFCSSSATFCSSSATFCRSGGWTGVGRFCCSRFRWCPMLIS